MSTSLDTWFVREILVHEASLVRYLARRWQARDEIHDLRQETYLRVYEAAAKERPRSAKAFLFTTARHLIADLVRRKRVVSIEAGWDPDVLGTLLVDEVSPERNAGSYDDLRIMAEAFRLLPPRCREVVWLRKVEGKSQREIAAQLGIGESMVEKHLAKAARRFADALYGTEAREDSRRRVPGNIVREGDYAQQHTD